MHETPIPLTACPHCAAQMPETAAFCPGCGRSMTGPPRATGRVGLLPENIAGALAYISFIPAIVFLLVEPYKRNRFARFHSIQCLLVWGAGILLGVLIRLAGAVLFIIPALGPLLVLLIDVVVVLAVLFLWMVLVIKALQGEVFQLPLLGPWAWHRSDGA